MQSTLKTFCIGLATIGHLFVGSVVVAADEGEYQGNAKRGKKLYIENVCHTCHGRDALTPLLPGYPKLAGQDEKYLVRQVIDIRDGKRANDMTGTMKSYTKGLKDKEVADIAAWIASLSICAKPADNKKDDKGEKNL